MEHDYEVEYRPGITHKLVDGVSNLQINEEGQDVVDEEVPCLVTVGGPGGDAAKPDNTEAVIAFWSSAEAETRAEHTERSAGLDVDGKPATPDPFTMEEFLQAQKVDMFCRERAEC